MSNINSEILKMVEQGHLKPFTDKSGLPFCTISIKGNPDQTYELYSHTFRLALQSHCRKAFDQLLSQYERQEMLEYLEVIAFENKLPYNLSHRINNDGETILYELNSDTSTCIKVKGGNCQKIKTPSKIFSRADGFKNQVEPNLDTPPTALPELLGRHVNLTGNDLLLLCFYLITAFIGYNIKQNILVVFGEKGSAKSTLFRRLSAILDPGDTDLCSEPSLDALVLRLNQSYFLPLDNLGRISKKISNILAQAVTGGSYPIRMLYTNSKIINLNLRCLVGLNGVSLTASESDLLDRGLVFHLKRKSKSDIIPESQLDALFSKDLPDILGAIFNALALVMVDNKPVTAERIRMADAFDYYIKAGRALGYSDDKTAKIIWENANMRDHHALDNNAPAACLIHLIDEEEEFQGSVSELLGYLKDIAKELNIHQHLMPTMPNKLSQKLNEVKSNLENEYSIFYEIKNIGRHKQITVWKK